MRFAFLTPEFVTDYPDGGGLGNYLNRITRLLSERGHSVELFIPSSLEPRVLMHDDVRVERVCGRWPFRYRVLMRAAKTAVPRSLRLGEIYLRAQAALLADAMERRHQVKPFDVIQSADYLAVGLGVQRNSQRVHMIRCSCPIDLYNMADGKADMSAKIQEKLEFESISRADLCYSPSRFTAEHYQEKIGRHVGIVRPPRSLEVSVAPELPFGLPAKYLVHFGQLSSRKGLDWLIESLSIAFERDNSLRVVIAGAASAHDLSRKLRAIHKHRDKLILLYPLPKAQMMRVVQQAVASVLPSVIDNLPNTVIESLNLGVPVIGTLGASIDELVEDGVSGRLVPPNDACGLAEAIIEVWQGSVSFKKGFVWNSDVAKAMTDEAAVDALIRFASRSELAAND